MHWKTLPLNDQRKGKWLSRSLQLLLTLGFCLLPAGAAPFVEMKFHLNSGTSLANTGTAGTSATLSAPNPTFSANTPFGGGAHAIDIASAAGTSAVDLLTGEVLNAAKDLKSFTIMGWLNCRSATVSPGGNRIVSWYQPLNAGDGVDLAMTSSGALSLGVDSWNDWSGVASNGGKLTVDGAASYNNWRFFAVTYDETVTTGHVKFYFGTSTSPAELDRSANYDQGPTGTDIAASVTFGNHSTAARNSSSHAAFRGMMDEIRVFGSKTNGDGALSLSMIQSLQGAAPLAGQPGLLYERWNNINGTAISSLTSNSRFPSTPDQTLVRTTFEGFVNAGDNFGLKMSGWIEAPVTGNYIFALTSDDAGELRLSSNSNPVNKLLILSNPTWTSAGTWAQQSGPIPLEAGKFYYIEALLKEGTGGDHLKVGWRRPSDAEIQVIGSPALFVTPPQTDVLYPSAYHLYEPGTGTRKATMGWHKEQGNSHFYIEAEGHRSLKVQNGSVVVPDRLFFGGEYPADPEQNDLGFRWDRGSQGSIGMLNIETQGGQHWAMRVRAPSTEIDHEQQPEVEINHQLLLKGDPALERGAGGLFPWAGWSVWNSFHYIHGMETERAFQVDGNPYTYKTQNDGIDFSMQSRNEPFDGMFIAEDSMALNASRISFWGGFVEPAYGDRAVLNQYGLQVFTDGSAMTEVTSYYVRTDDVYAKTITVEDLVTTPKWRIPDYVFEDKYPLRSLDETEAYVKRHKHLPDIPSAKDIAKQGLSQGEMNAGLLKTVEEMTLHLIAIKKDLEAQKRETTRLRQELKVGKAGKERGTK